jgi:Uma2 family endonuclease
MIGKDPEISFLEFVAWEQEQADRHELIAGEVVRFLGGSIDHETIAVNIIAKLHAAVEPPCKVFGSAAIVQTVSRIGEDGYRPDVTVSCAATNIGSRLYVADPKVIVEVLSPSNAGPKWNAKLFEYWNTASIEQLVFVDALERSVTSHVRDENGRWNAPVVSAGHGSLVFAPLGITMTLSKIYQNTSLAD